MNTPHNSREALLQAIARGWCSLANQHKEMDATLAEAICDEVQAAPSHTSQSSDRMREALHLALGALRTCTPGDYTTGHVIHPYFDEDHCRNAELAIEAALSSLPEQEGKSKWVNGGVSASVVVTTNESGDCVLVSRQDEEGRVVEVIWEASKPAEPSETIERNFCTRCGKRLGKGALSIHTCTPPMDESEPSEKVREAWHIERGVIYNEDKTRQIICQMEHADEYPLDHEMTAHLLSLLSTPAQPSNENGHV